MDQQVFQPFDGLPVAREDESRPFVEHGVRARVDSLHLSGSMMETIEAPVRLRT